MKKVKRSSRDEKNTAKNCDEGGKKQGDGEESTEKTEGQGGGEASNSSASGSAIQREKEPLTTGEKKKEGVREKENMKTNDSIQVANRARGTVVLPTNTRGGHKKGNGIEKGRGAGRLNENARGTACNKFF